jgi:hypothetical protein
VNALADLRAGRSVRGDCVAVEFSDHAVERFAERAGREQEPDQVRRELSRMLASMTVSGTRPDWLKAGTFTGSMYLLVGTDCTMPGLIRDGRFIAITTVFARAPLSDDALLEHKRANGQRGRDHKRAVRQGKKRQHGRPVGSPRRRKWAEGEG